MSIKNTSIAKPSQHTAKHDKNGCKDNPRQNITTLGVSDTSYTFSMKHDYRQQNLTTTAVKTTQNKTTLTFCLNLHTAKHNIHGSKRYINYKTLQKTTKHNNYE